jgi:tRNA (mo5U34)-methyltransferase
MSAAASGTADGASRTSRLDAVIRSTHTLGPQGAGLVAPDLKTELESGPRWMYDWPLGPGITVPLIHHELPDVHRTRAEVIEPVARAALAGAGANAIGIDLGCSEGFFSQLLLDWGACSVLGIDVRDVNLIRAALLRDHFGIPPEQLRFHRSNVNDLDPEEFGRYDVVLALGLVYHLEDPVGFLRIARALTAGVFIVESQLTRQDAAIEYGWGAANSCLSTDASFAAAVECYETDCTTASPTGTLSLIPNRAALELMLRVAGFEDIDWLEPGEDHNEQYRRGDRAIAVARVSA